MENPNDVMVTPLAPAWYRYGLLIVCVMGLCGNMLNLFILRRRRLLATLSSVERSSNRTLIALAMSDLLFCLSLLPAVAYTDEPYTQPFHRRHVLYYKAYGMPMINVFLVTSTYLIVLTALMRYLAVASPFTGRTNCFIRHSGSASICVCFAVFVMVLPQFFLYEVLPLQQGLHSSSITTNVTMSKIIPTAKNSVLTTTSSTILFTSATPLFYTMEVRFAKKHTKRLGVYILRVQPVLFSFLPGLLLVFFNVGLIRCLRRAKEERRYVCIGQRIGSGSPTDGGVNGYRLSVTLVVMFITHIVLVIPSDVIKYFAPYDMPAGDVIACALNLAQAVNFALNFLLYVSLNATFRDTFNSTARRLFGCEKRRQGFSDSEAGGGVMQLESINLGEKHIRVRCGHTRLVNLSTTAAPTRSLPPEQLFDVL